MKLLLTVLSMLILKQASSIANFVTKEKANSLLGLDEEYYARSRRGIMGKSVKSVQKRWKNYCKFNSVEKWNEFKDDVEETNLPEKEVDRLEKCTFRCARKDEAADLVGKAYEEKREKQEEKGKPFVAACPQCFMFVPKSGKFKFPKKCRNSKSGVFGK